MRIITTLILIGILIISCDSKKRTILSKSKFLTDSIYSDNLGEFRKYNVYLPKGFNSEKKYPILYATDGGSSLTEKKNLFDSLIDNNTIKPIIFVASFANSKIADSTSTTTGDGKKVYLSYRNFEYVDRKPKRPEDSLLVDRFQNHKMYFIDELIPEIENKYNQDINKTDRYFYGVSNGAGFGLSLLNANPDLFGTYICFSVFGGDIQSNTWAKNIKYPNLYLRYGSDEFFGLKEDAEFLESKYAESNSFIETREYEGGHSNKFWKEEFAEVLPRIFKKE
ncbi:MAG: esterase [Leeuwenhoekiella sp.]|nr:esterase [Leeuwenhoekiella sp.]MBA80884.1 esterase [Leeuwenhoekiella sp.]|tara:strand:- start:81520 stop:82359 length:840 start_codon:yes stop_codon:yes gene_type:complete